MNGAALACIAILGAVCLGLAGVIALLVFTTSHQQRRILTALMLEQHPQAYAATVITEHRRKARADETPKPRPSLDEVP